jgi:cbb3-type cytochrome oxidase maturation protein
MEALYLLIPLSVAIVFFAIWVFFHMSDSGQFDDMDSPAWRILQDDDKNTEADQFNSNLIHIKENDTTFQ